ncbi:MAG: hypothetical protein COA57_06165 [Flavobacteriales bacterium]|nr:MAG: hypothetical protein COA57_06165 [Flavobacteriales bacterium]
MTHRANSFQQKNMTTIIEMKKCFLLFTLYFLLFTCIAQVNDAWLWTRFRIEKMFSETFSISLREEFRFDENISELGGHLTDIGATYTPKKFIAFGVHYRFSGRKRLNDSYNQRHRYYLQVSLKGKADKLSVTLRNRYQSQYTDIYTRENGQTPTNLWRTKLTMKLVSKKKIAPFISTEWFYRLNDREFNDFEKMRYIAGLEYQVDKRNRVDLFYLIQSKLNDANPRTDYVSGIGYKYAF